MTTTTLADAVRGCGADRVNIRCWAPVVWDSADGPVVGASYRCDYRAEEEYGTRDLRNALRGEDPRRIDPVHTAGALTGVFDDANAVVAATCPLPKQLRWGSTELGYGLRYAEHYTQTLAYAQGADTRLGWKTVAELRTLAERDGLPRPWPRRKDDLVAALTAHRGGDTPWQWPGWFYDGHHLVLRADGGVAADVIGHLADAARANTLTVAPDSGPFHAGLLLVDARDIGPQTRAATAAAWDLHDEQMAAIDGVKPALVDAGFHVHFLGRPRVVDGRVVYWLNCWLRGAGQVSGSFTADELTVDNLRALAEAQRGR